MEWRLSRGKERGEWKAVRRGWCQQDDDRSGRGGYMVPRLCNFLMPALLPLLDDWPDVEAWLFPRLCCCFGGGSVELRGRDLWAGAGLAQTWWSSCGAQSTKPRKATARQLPRRKEAGAEVSTVLSILIFMLDGVIQGLLLSNHME